MTMRGSRGDGQNFPSTTLGAAMPIEMIGWIAPRVSSELIPPSGPPFDASVIGETARIHEGAGFDRVLNGYFSDAPDGFLVGAHAASVTERLSFLLAHRPGFVAPPVAARKLATLDQLSDGGNYSLDVPPKSPYINNNLGARDDRQSHRSDLQ